MIQVLLVEENALLALSTYLMAKLPDYLQAVETVQLTTKLDLPMFQKIEIEYVDPEDIFTFPFAMAFVADSEDDVQDRALDKNTCIVRLMTAIVGKRSTLKSYRYHSAIREAIQNDRTLGRRGCRARVMRRVYYSPVSKGDQEVRVAESYIEITMEVQRR